MSANANTAATTVTPGATIVTNATSATTETQAEWWAKHGFGSFDNAKVQGKFTSKESEVVRKAVEEFCAAKQISVGRLCSECDHKAELKGAWMEIAKRLPHRSVQSVYRHGLRQLHPFKRGAWTDEECEQLLELVTRLGKKWAAIQHKLNRSADSCRDKHREMNDDYVRGRWKSDETEHFKKIVREHLQAAPTADMKELGKKVESEGIKIPWSVISKRMGKRSRLACFKKWQKITGQFSASDSYKAPAGKDSTRSSTTTTASSISVSSATSTRNSTAAGKKRSDGISSKIVRKVKAATAGAAAALASVAAVNNPISSSTDATTPSPPSDFDTYLLTELVSLDVTRASDIDWDSIRLENAEKRWDELLEEWQNQDGLDESSLSLPLSQLAQLMFERKSSAQRAAETVEAVLL